MVRVFVALARRWRRFEAWLFARPLDESPIELITLDDVDGGIMIFVADATISGMYGSESDLCLTGEPFGSTIDTPDE